MPDQSKDIQASLRDFTDRPLADAARAFLDTLGYRSDRELETLRDAKTKAPTQAEKGALNKRIRQIIDTVQASLLQPGSSESPIHP